MDFFGLGLMIMINLLNHLFNLNRGTYSGNKFFNIFQILD